MVPESGGPPEGFGALWAWEVASLGVWRGLSVFSFLVSVGREGVVTCFNFGEAVLLREVYFFVFHITIHMVALALEMLHCLLHSV